MSTKRRFRVARIAFSASIALLGLLPLHVGGAPSMPPMCKGELLGMWVGEDAWDILVMDCGVTVYAYGQGDAWSDPVFLDALAASEGVPAQVEQSALEACVAAAKSLCGGTACIKHVIYTDGTCDMECKTTPACDPPTKPSSTPSEGAP